MRQHILLENANRYTVPQTDAMPVGYSFDELGGYWKNDYTGKALMLSEDRRVPNSKKCDRETGEDQKGE